MYVKKKMYAAYVSKHDLNPEKSYSFKDSKWRKRALSCSKKTINITKRHYIKKCR